jgi:ribosomal-protein-alanine N-acetyltransferase
MDILPKIRKAFQADAKLLANLHKISFDAGWSLESFQSLLSLPSTQAYVFEEETSQKILGMIVFQVVDQEAEILTFAIDPFYQQKGYGENLYTFAESELRNQKITTLYLEVAEDNDPALAFYYKQKFHKIGTRPQYYPRPNNTGANAFLLSKNL